MKTKHPLKSKTILFSLVTIIVAILNIVGPGDYEPENLTWDDLGKQHGRQTEQITNLLTLLGGGGAVYGRFAAKDKIGKEKEDED